MANEVKILSLRRAKYSRTAEMYKKAEGNATIYISDRSAKPLNGIWKEVEAVGKNGIFFVKTATFYGRHIIWQFMEKADKVILK